MADDSSDGGEKDRNAPTVRDLVPRALSSDTVPDIVGQYVPPRPLPEASQHRTLDLRSVRVSPDPTRAAPTELRLASPVRAEPKSSKWWLIGAGVVLGGGLLWLLLRTPPPSTEPASVEAPAPPATVEEPTARPGSPLVVVKEPVAPSPSATAAPSGEPASAENPGASSASPKPPAARASEKKRRNPWFE